MSLLISGAVFSDQTRLLTSSLRIHFRSHEYIPKMTAKDAKVNF